MRRIVYDVPKWNIYLHRRARKLPRATEYDKVPACFQDELFDKLFESRDPIPAGHPGKGGPSTTDINRTLELHKTCNDLVMQVKTHCVGNAAQSALATEWIMETMFPDRKSKAPQQSGQAHGAAHDAAHGMEQVGDAESDHAPYDEQNTKRVQEIADLIKDDARLKKIALLAGRFKRIMISKQKTKIRHETDEISDIEQGGEISRLLPSELVKFLSPRLQLVTKADLLERKLLQYSVQASEKLGRGPLVFCVDKSGSMEGEKDIWACAVALALMDMAHRQKRVFIMLGFNDRVFQKVVVRPGKQIPLEHLCVMPNGGTDILEVLDLAVLATERRGVMKRADIVLVTDGESDPSKAEWIKARAAKNDVSILGVGIGPSPEQVLPWCNEAYSITDMGQLSDELSQALFQR